MLALEVAVPPLSVLSGLLLLASACFLAAPVTPLASTGLVASLMALAALSLALVAVTIRELGPRRTLRTVMALPAYLAWKLPVLVAYATDRERAWTKTPRDRRRPSASTIAAASTGGSQRT